MDHVHFLAQLTGFPNPGRLILKTKKVDTDAERQLQARVIVEYCALIYDKSCSLIRERYLSFIQNPKQKDIDIFKLIRDCCYPCLTVEQEDIRNTNTEEPRHLEIEQRDASETAAEEPGHLNPYAVRLRAADYSTTLAEPRILESYLVEQIFRLLEAKYPIECGLSIVPIPFPYALDREEVAKSKPSHKVASLVQSFFPMPSTTDIEDSVVDGTYRRRNDSISVNLEYQLFDSRFWTLYRDYLIGEDKKHRWCNCEPTRTAFDYAALVGTLKRKHPGFSSLFEVKNLPKRISDVLKAEKGKSPREAPRIQYFGRSSSFPRPLAHFDALRTDYAIARLKHYTHTPAQYIQPYQLFTNYHKYVLRFVMRCILEIYNRTSGTLIIPFDRSEQEDGFRADKHAIDHARILSHFGQPLLGKLTNLFIQAPHDRARLETQEYKTAISQFDQLVRALLREPGAQMPCYHYVPGFKESQVAPSTGERERWVFEDAPLPGMTLVNIGVGPSNARTITDHLAVLRPSCWMMVGLCGGLRLRQELGDYVLGSSYVRRDGVLDAEVPLDAPVTASLDVINAITLAAEHRLRQDYREKLTDGGSPVASAMKSRYVPEAGPLIESEVGHLELLKGFIRTGTVVTTSNRNWETSPTEQYFDLFEQYRAVAVDMESATIATNGYRHRIPHGTFLCVSDKPLHGVIKMRFFDYDAYRAQTDRHLDIAMNAIKWLKLDIQSSASIENTRSLRGLDDPPWQ